MPVPNTFIANTKIKSEEVNDNFSARDLHTVHQCILSEETTTTSTSFVEQDAGAFYYSDSGGTASLQVLTFYAYVKTTSGDTITCEIYDVNSLSTVSSSTVTTTGQTSYNWISSSTISPSSMPPGEYIIRMKTSAGTAYIRKAYLYYRYR